MKRPRRPKQLSLIETSKKKRAHHRAPRMRARVPHRTRPPHAERHPVHITLRVRRGIPLLRHELVRKLVMALFEQVRARTEEVHGEDAFQLVEASIQDDHLHLMVEAKDKLRLSSGIRSFVIRFALRLNRLLGRATGKVWADRYHRRDLETPSEVRSCLVYILANWKKHMLVLPRTVPLCDPYSSASGFEGWTGEPLVVNKEAWPRFVPRTWLLRAGWKRAGVITPFDAPKGEVLSMPA
jgi:REP element-mobilizing transposase RayT